MSDHSNSANLPSASEDTDKVSFVLRDGVAGVIARVAVVSAVVLAAAVGLAWCGGLFGWFDELPVIALIGIAAAVWIAMVAGVVCSEYPRGDQLAMARLGLATFCRTGLPLLVVLVAVNYATRLNSIALYVGVLYAFGLAVSLLLEVSRLGVSPFASRHNRVRKTCV